MPSTTKLWPPPLMASRPPLPRRPSLSLSSLYKWNRVEPFSPLPKLSLPSCALFFARARCTRTSPKLAATVRGARRTIRVVRCPGRAWTFCLHRALAASIPCPSRPPCPTPCAPSSSLCTSISPR
jgi:hypothetical protein